MKGMYVVLEGGEYVGKTTQAQMVADQYHAQYVREPGSTAMGNMLRQLLLDPDVDLGIETQTLLHAAARSELVKDTIRPTLATGTHVISDRSWLSSAVYQGVQGVPFERVRAINEFAIGELTQPDICIVLDADPEAIATRAYGTQQDYYESKGSEFHRQVRGKYLEIAQEIGATVIDATMDTDLVNFAICNRINAYINSQ